MKRALATAFVALLLTIASASINPTTDERAMYGLEGPLEQNWLPREVAGWPAPFMADSPGISVAHVIGPEDDFRAGPFLASFSFWFLVASVLLLLFGAMSNMRRQNTSTPSA